MGVIPNSGRPDDMVFVFLFPSSSVALPATIVMMSLLLQSRKSEELLWLPVIMTKILFRAQQPSLTFAGQVAWQIDASTLIRRAQTTLLARR